MHLIEIILIALACYLMIGVGVGLAFALVGVRRVDPVAHEAPVRVRLLFLPGAAALWPVALAMWARAGAER